MLTQEIEKVLTTALTQASMLGSTYEDSEMTDETYEKYFKEYISQATLALLELFKKVLPKEIIENNVVYQRGSYYGEAEGKIYKEGYNQCLADIKDKLGRMDE